jgi:hypothetical protein
LVLRPKEVPVKRVHVAAIAIVVGLAVVLGGVALSRSSGGEAAAVTQVPVGTLSARAAQLDRLESSLKRQLAEAPKPADARVITRYVRPAPRHVVVSRHHGDDDHEYDDEREHDGGDDD